MWMSSHGLVGGFPAQPQVILNHLCSILCLTFKGRECTIYLVVLLGSSPLFHISNLEVPLQTMMLFMAHIWHQLGGGLQPFDPTAPQRASFLGSPNGHGLAQHLSLTDLKSERKPPWRSLQSPAFGGFGGGEGRRTKRA